jgi:hypothetical protein
MTVLQTVSRLNRPEATAALIAAFAALGAGRHAVGTARDGFGPILRHARNGTPQLIGLKPKSMTVVMSLSDLIDMIQVAAKGQSFAAALDAEGFRLVSGKKIEVREGFPAEPLVWRRFKESDGQ